MIDQPADYILTPEFTRDAEVAIDRARQETLAAGVAVFYRDAVSGVEIMEQPGDRNYEVVGHARKLIR